MKNKEKWITKKLTQLEWFHLPADYKCHFLATIFWQVENVAQVSSTVEHTQQRIHSLKPHCFSILNASVKGTFLEDGIQNEIFFF